MPVNVDQSSWSQDARAQLVARIRSGELTVEQAVDRHGLAAEVIRVWLAGVQAPAASDFAQFSGRLPDVAILDVMQTIELHRKDGILTVTTPMGTSTMWFRGGRFIDAVSGALTAEAAFYRMLTLDQGTFSVQFAPHDRPKSIASKNQSLVLEGSRRLDESHRAVQSLPPMDESLRYNPCAPAAASLTPQQREVAQLFTYDCTIAQALERSRAGQLETLQILTVLRQFEALLPAPPVATPTQPAPGPESGPSAWSDQTPRLQMTEARPRRRWWPLGLAAAGLGAAALVFAMFAPVGEVAPSAVDEDGAQPGASAVSANASAASQGGGDCPSGMVHVGAGEFTMGADNEHPALRSATPARTVRVSSFCIDAYEVTLDEYRECSTIGECKRAYRNSWWPQGDATREQWETARLAYANLCNERYPDHGDHPVNCVTFHQARAYCQWQNKTLPTEAQWEFAARGASSQAYPWGDEPPTATRVNGCGRECGDWRANAGLPPLANLHEEDDGYPGTAAVGRFPAGASGQGVHDLIGNVSEWTADGPYKYGDMTPVDPRGPADSDERVVRGGSFDTKRVEATNPARRRAQDQTTRAHDIGFRCSAEPTGP